VIDVPSGCKWFGMWDGYDLNVWFAERDDNARRSGYLRLLGCLDRASRGLDSFRVGRSPVEASPGTLLDAIEKHMTVGDGLRSGVTTCADWELWEPKVTWPAGEPLWVARRTASVEHVRTHLSVYARYNAGGPDHFMPPRRAGDAYVHLGDGVADDDGYHHWSWQPQARQKRDENRRQFEAFLFDVIASVRPEHLLVTPGIFTRLGVHDSLLVFHQDPREFLRDLLRALFLLEDSLRRWVETPEGEVAEVRVDYMDDAMREPERLVSETRLQELQSRCIEWIKTLLSRNLNDVLVSREARLERLAWCLHAPRTAAAIRSRSAAEITEILLTSELPALRQAGSGWLVMDRDHPVLLETFFEGLVAGISIGALA
jgi:hypothetical protein